MNINDFIPFYSSLFNLLIISYLGSIFTPKIHTNVRAGFSLYDP